MRLGHSKDRIKSTWWKSKSRVRSKSLGGSLKKLHWKCIKARYFKKNYRSKSVKRGKGSYDTSSIKKKSSKKGGDVYLDSTTTQSKSVVWLIDFGASFHMTPHKSRKIVLRIHLDVRDWKHCWLLSLHLNSHNERPT